MNGVAALTTSTLNASSTNENVISAQYIGNANYKSSTSPNLTETSQYATTTTLPQFGANPSTYGTMLYITAVVTGGQGSHPTGTVQFFNGATLIGSATLSFPGTAFIAVNNLPVGTNSITASYQGDGFDLPSTSSAFLQAVTQATSTVALTANLSPAIYGSAVTLTAAVTPSIATGTVLFFNGSTQVGSATIANGQAQVTAQLPAGALTLTAAASSGRRK